MENNWVDFRLVKSTVTMAMALDHYQINWLRRSGDELRGRCPIHQGEGQDTFHASLTKNAFQCFSCKAHGNVLDFVAAMEQCTVRDAALKLQQWFTITTADAAQPVPTTGQSESRGEDLQKNQPLKFQLKGIDPNHAYLTERGIRIETAQAFGVGFYPGKGSMAGRIVIPIHNEQGELLAYAGRSIDGSEPRYKLPEGFKKSQLVYNLQRVIGKNSTVILVEGFFGCMKLAQAGFTSVALMGSSLSEAQADLLCEYFTGFVLMFDGDDAGKLATDECLLTLGHKGRWVRALTLAAGAQPDDLSDGELIELLEK
jgi:DNA primase